MSAAAILTQPQGTSYSYTSRVTEIRNSAGVKVVDLSTDATLITSTTAVDVSAPVVTLPGISTNATETTVAKAVVTSDLDVTANITAATASVPVITAVTSVATPLITDATSITLSAPAVTLTGDLAMENVVANVSATAPVVNATTKLVTELIETTAPTTSDLVIAAREVTFNSRIAVSGDVIAGAFRTANPLADDMTVTAKNIILNGNVEIKGTLDTINTEILTVKDKEIVLGVIDADGDGVADAGTDVLRDGGGLLISGTPANMPGGTDAALYEHSLRWRLKDGDFDTGGAAMAPHQKPMWTFNGGGLAVATPDLNGAEATWFMSPYFDATSQTASLGLYFKADGFAPVLVQNFSTPIPTV
jgi:hypothetical protein